MKLQTKLVLGLLGGVLTVYLASAVIQLKLSSQSISRFSRQSRAGEESRQWEWVERLQNATRASLWDAMAEGDMEKFNRILSSQSKVSGLQELSLFDADGFISESTDKANRKKSLPSELKKILLTTTNELKRRTETSFEVYQPIVCQKTCLECHPNKKAGQIAGVMSMRYSTEAFKAAEQSWVTFEHDSQKAGIITASGTALGLILAISVLTIVTIHYLLTKPLKRKVAGLSENANEVAHVAGSVGSASESAAQDASEQAASVEEIGASLEEISSMAKQTAEHAQSVDALSRQTHTAAEQGAKDMNEMCGTMQSISDSGADICKIVKTIDEIAFQTNILALNAAVEAARAGEAGLGFAVVADEVRNLSLRSTQAAKETAAKIESTILRTKQGVEVSGKVLKTFNEIVNQVKQVSELLSEVSSASREQTQGIGQINIAVNEMEKVTQRNAAFSEKSAEVAGELNAQAGSMKQSAAELLGLVTGEHQTSPESDLASHNHWNQSNGSRLELSGKVRGEGVAQPVESVSNQN